MKKVIRYECEHCKKTFKINKHFCFKDPKNKACGSCENYLGTEYFTTRNGTRHIQYICWNDGLNKIIHCTDSSLNCSDEIPFGNYHGNRGYNCDWWTERKKQ